jgi:hypothetical protein
MNRILFILLAMVLLAVSSQTGASIWLGPACLLVAKPEKTKKEGHQMYQPKATAVPCAATAMLLVRSLTHP